MVEKNPEIPPQIPLEQLTLTAFIFTMVEENFEISPPQMPPQRLTLTA